MCSGRQCERPGVEFIAGLWGALPAVNEQGRQRRRSPLNRRRIPLLSPGVVVPGKPGTHGGAGASGALPSTNHIQPTGIPAAKTTDLPDSIPGWGVGDLAGVAFPPTLNFTPPNRGIKPATNNRAKPDSPLPAGEGWGEGETYTVVPGKPGRGPVGRSLPPAHSLTIGRTRSGTHGGAWAGGALPEVGQLPTASRAYEGETYHPKPLS